MSNYYTGKCFLRLSVQPKSFTYSGARKFPIANACVTFESGIPSHFIIFAGSVLYSSQYL
jgi:hypothetical protein